MGALSETLFESELFGHRKGAFTDAHDNKPGRLEIASGGSIFLDEIGNIPLAPSAKTADCFAEPGNLSPGSTLSRKIDVRLISATNVNPNALVADGKFREDLLYRINTIQITVPPL